MRRIFVFGSNTAGRHAGGAARFARDELGAEEGVGEGLTGQCYALPTCDANCQPLPFPEVALAVRRFLAFARAHTEIDFLVTAVGCGIAGFRASDIQPLFSMATDNVYLQARLAFGRAQ
jgi:hypothetical protein